MIDVSSQRRGWRTSQSTQMELVSEFCSGAMLRTGPRLPSFLDRTLPEPDFVGGLMEFCFLLPRPKCGLVCLRFASAALKPQSPAGKPKRYILGCRRGPSEARGGIEGEELQGCGPFARLYGPCDIPGCSPQPLVRHYSLQTSFLVSFVQDCQGQQKGGAL